MNISFTLILAKQNIYYYKFTGTGTIAINGEHYDGSEWQLANILRSASSLTRSTHTVRVYISIGTTINLDIKSSVVIWKKEREKRTWEGDKNTNWLAFYVVSSYCTKRAKMWTMTQYRLANQPTEKIHWLHTKWMAGATMESRPIGRSLTLYRSARRLVDRVGHSLKDKLWTFLLKDLYNPCDMWMIVCDRIFRAPFPCSPKWSKIKQILWHLSVVVVTGERLFVVRLLVTQILLQELRYFSNRGRNSEEKKNWKFDIRCTIFIWQSEKLFAAQSRYLVAREMWDFLKIVILPAEQIFLSIFTVRWNETGKFGIWAKRTPGTPIGSKLQLPRISVVFHIPSSHFTESHRNGISLASICAIHGFQSRFFVRTFNCKLCSTQEQRHSEWEWNF